MKQPLTKVQQQTYQFLTKFYKKYKYMPTHKEIAKHFKRSIGGTTEYRLQILEKKGHIKREKSRTRYILLVN